MANFLVRDSGEFIAVDPKIGEEIFRAKTNTADTNGEWGDKIVPEMDEIIGDLEYIGKKSEFSEGDPVWFARYYYPKRTLGIISQSYGKNIVFEGEIFLFDQFGSTAIWNFVAKKIGVFSRSK